jgi:hypothetical protein
MEQVTLDCLAVFDGLVTDAARRPEGCADADGRGNRSDLFHLRVMMMMCSIHPRVMMLVMMMVRASRGFRRAAYQH